MEGREGFFLVNTLMDCSSTVNFEGVEFTHWRCVFDTIMHMRQKRDGSLLQPTLLLTQSFSTESLFSANAASLQTAS